MSTTPNSSANKTNGKKTIFTFDDILEKYRTYSFSQRDKGTRFERLMKNFLSTYQRYAGKFQNIWLWNEFPGRKDFGSGIDTGIDLVAQTTNNEYWAIQCKCYQADTTIDKAEIDTFLSTSSKSFTNEQLQTTTFSYRLWISTTNKWGNIAEETIRNQNPPVLRISLADLQTANVDWAELDKGITGVKAQKKHYDPLPHQQEAIDKVCKHFKDEDRAKMIMACGTGKTYTSLKIAEKLTDNKGLILVLVPSISLLSQLLKEWTEQATNPINAICICSKPDASKNKTEDETFSFVEDLALPASTDINNIVKQFEYIKGTKQKAKGLTVVFSTYQSIDVISQAQKKLNKLYDNKYIFDLIVCDEAHRTTGQNKKDEEEKAFTKVHSNKNIQAKKRLYMTATPRLYDENAKQKADQKEILLCSMDDEEIYGKEVYRIGFGEAVDKQLLSDYKVLVLTLREDQIPKALQRVITNSENEINTDDIAKLIGCINALSKRMFVEDDLLKTSDPAPMHKAVAFCQTIKISQKITGMFKEHKNKYYESLTQEDRKELVDVSSQHIDGTMSATVRQDKLLWLKQAPTDTNECRILTNVRCLSEGVDVPSLDAVMFLAAKNSEIDVVQSVGRVMRKAPNKQYGYIIIPIIIPADVEPEKALDNNEKYKVVWQVLNALRAHDDRFNAIINKISINKKSSHIIVGGIGGSVVSEEQDGGYGNKEEQLTLPLEYLNKVQNAVYARMVQKVGNKKYWEQWAKQVGDIAIRYEERINRLIKQDDKHKKAFEKFLNGIRKNINPSIKQDEVVQMLAQHIITKPIFEALFENYSFVKNNPMSKSMQRILDLLEDQALEKDTITLDRFYTSVKLAVYKINNAEGKQKIIVELYEKFFKTAFPKVVEKLGIVYTPVEVVDFINNSVAQILKKEFNRSLSDENIHILDPFTGTGTFITRLLQTGLIDKKSLERKYSKELHCNEIVLLAYYIASINIETAFYDLMTGEKEYKSFNGICLTDTFQLGETDKADELFSDMLEQNSKRVIAQKKAPIRIIIGNPPYSIGQKSANDNAQNQSYSKLETKIAETYVKHSTATLNRGLYDSYIKAFRWSTDRIDKNNGGIIGFITNSGWLDTQAMDGFRQCLQQDFTSIYVFNLRGAIRGKIGDNAKREGQNVFDIMTGVAITILVKNPNVKTDKAKIYYHDIGDYLKRTEKLDLLKKYNNILSKDITLQELKPNKENDWLNKRNDKFSSYIQIEPTKKFDINSQSYFSTYSLGVATNKDPFMYNFSKVKNQKHIQDMIDFYNAEREKYHKANKKYDIVYDKTKINWTDLFLRDLKNNVEYKLKEDSLCTTIHRLFTKKNFCYEKNFLQRTYQQLKIFPTSNHKNLCISITGLRERRGFAVFMVNTLVDLNVYDGGTQCFPLYWYEENNIESPTLFDTDNQTYTRKDGITDFILKRFQEQYSKSVTKEDIFFYVYGILHSKDYKTTFANDLKKMLPRIPLVEKPSDFKAFVKAGRELADLHLNYETQKPLKGLKIVGANSKNYTVEKMKFFNKEDKNVILYNPLIRIENIPKQAYEYIVNGRSAIEWVMEQYQVDTDKDSHITNDPNDWSKEHNNPSYILDLLLSVITVSVKTVEIVNNLPKLNL